MSLKLMNKCDWESYLKKMFILKKASIKALIPLNLSFWCSSCLQPRVNFNVRCSISCNSPIALFHRFIIDWINQLLSVRGQTDVITRTRLQPLEFALLFNKIMVALILVEAPLPCRWCAPIDSTAATILNEVHLKLHNSASPLPMKLEWSQLV